MNQASSRTRTRPSRGPSRRSRKRALLSLPRWVPRRTRRSISGTAPTRHPCSTTAARHSQPWPRRNRDRFGLALWLWWISDPGALAETRSTTVSVDDDVPDRRLEQRREGRQQRLPDGEPRPAAALEEPVVAGPAPRQPGGQDRVGDVAAAGGRGAEQQLGEGGAGAPRHGGGETSDEGSQDRRGNGRGDPAEPARREGGGAGARPGRGEGGGGGTGVGGRGGGGGGGGRGRPPHPPPHPAPPPAAPGLGPPRRPPRRGARL